MRRHEQLHLAATVQHCREELEGLHLEPTSARDDIGAITARLSAVEAALRTQELPWKWGTQAALARGWAPLRSARTRYGYLVAPRIGMLRQHSPRPLLVPTRYLLTKPPSSPPTISIVTPSFQQGRFLARTLYSVVSQDYPALEYVVQDGGSADETLDALYRFDHLLTRWTSEPDDGQADAINRGFEHTTGEIMAYLNSDDLLLPGSLATVAQYFVAHPDVDVVYGHRILIDAEDRKIGSWILPRHHDRTLTLADYVPQETLFWRRRIWQAAGGSIDESFRYAIDWDLLLRFRDAGAKIVRMPRFLGAFRVHDDQKTTVHLDLGLSECARLRNRVHGRDMSLEEVLTRLRPYFRRHVVVHTLQRVADRLPLQRTPVLAFPLELPAPARRQASCARTHDVPAERAVV